MSVFSRFPCQPGRSTWPPAWLLRALTEYAGLNLVWIWLLGELADFSFWPGVPVVLALWPLLRGFALLRLERRGGAGTIGSWLESTVAGLVLVIAGAALFLDLPLSNSPRLAAWSLGAMLAVEMTCRRGNRWRLARWLVPLRKGCWPHLGETLAIFGSVWAWQRLTGTGPLPLPVCAWVAGTAGALLFLQRNRGALGWSLIAPCVAVGPVLWTYAGTPDGQPWSRLALLGVAALAFPWMHRRIERTDGPRPTRLAWIWVLVLVGVWLGEPLLHARAAGAGDAQWYANVLEDAIAQFRAGIFPPLVGQSIYAFNGSIFPGSFAPYYQAAGVAIHALTAGALPAYSIQHLLAVGSIVGGMLAVFAVLRRQSRASQAACAAVAILYGASPAWLAAIYSMDMYMTLLTMPWIPLVFHGAVMTFQRLEARSVLWTAVPLALVWLAHPPIGLWTTLVLAVVHAWRWLRCRQAWCQELRWLAGSTGLFAVLTCLPMAAAFSTERVTDSFRHDYVIGTLAEHWRRAWLPISPGADLLSDQQLGWSLALCGLAGLLLGWRRREGAAAGFGLATTLLVLLLAPIPGVQSSLWRGVPEFIKHITDNWPSQRLIPVLAGLLAVVGGGALLRTLADSKRGRTLATLGLVAAVAWSLGEASKFRQRGHRVTATPEDSYRRQLPENISLTRYAYHMFGHQPHYVSDGVMNPNLKQSLLDLDSLRPLATNLSAAGDGPATETFRLEADPATTDSFDFRPVLHLRPGQEYFLEFEFGRQEIAGTLLVQGRRLDRQYPVNGASQNTGLGRAAGQRKYISLWTTGNGMEAVRFRFLPREPGTVLTGVLATVRMTEIERARLPVQLETHSPFRATVRAPQEAWLETSRMHLPGYTATHNGIPAEVRSSPEGLVLVRVPAGHGRVELFYRPPGPVLLALVITIPAWLTLVIAPLVFWWSGRPPRRPDGPGQNASWTPPGLPQGEAGQ